jgi:hypothetical protein
MNERIDQLLIYAPIVLMLVLIGMSILIWSGPSVGGGLGVLHGALGDMLTGDDRAIVDSVAPADLAAAFAAMPPLEPPLESESVGAAPISLPVSPNPDPGTGCAAAHFETSIGIESGYVSFGRFSLVTDTDPYGKDDPLTAWKLLQFGGFPLDLEGLTPESTVIPVGQVVNLLISDPYSQEMLFSARWHVDAIVVQGRFANINAALGTNLDGFGIDNVVESPTLDHLSSAGEGVLVMGFEHSEDIAAALQAGRPVYANVKGTLYPANCLQ